MKKDNCYMINKSKALVHQFYNEKIVQDGIEIEEIYVVWFCKTLQNFKALLSTDKNDTRYYEVTYNGDKNEFYLDCYTKEYNKLIEGIV